LEEKPKMKKFSLRTALIAALVTALLLGTAYAVATTYGLQFWNVERIYMPDQEAAKKMIDAEQTAIQGECTNKLVNVTVGQAAWLSEDRFQVTLTAELRDKSRYELHPLQSLDTDGACISTSEPLPSSENGEPVEERYESFLWTDKGFGLPRDMMDDPTKQLVLFSEGAPYSDGTVTIGTADGTALSDYSMYDLRSADGNVQMMLEFDLSDMDPEKVVQKYASWDEMSDEQKTEGWKNDRYAYQLFVDESTAQAKEQAQNQADAIARYTDADGYLTLVLHDYALLFTADEKDVATFDYAHPDDVGTTTFKIKIK
jgi:hypothetical protein